SGIARLFQTVLQSLDCARELCVLLESYPGQFLKAEQTSQLEQRRGGLAEALSRLVARHAPEPVEPAEAPSTPPLEPFRINWIMNPVDPSTDLPDRAAFDANLAALLESCRAAGCQSSLLLVRVDKIPGLVARFGQARAEKLIKRLAGLICRAVRDEDLVCRINGETLAIMFPGLDIEAG